jgi:hypothetical protein
MPGQNNKDKIAVCKNVEKYANHAPTLPHCSHAGQFVHEAHEKRRQKYKAGKFIRCDKRNHCRTMADIAIILNIP